LEVGLQDFDFGAGIPRRLESEGVLGEGHAQFAEAFLKNASGVRAIACCPGKA